MAGPRLPVYSAGGLQADRMSVTIPYKSAERSGARQRHRAMQTQTWTTGQNPDRTAHQLTANVGVRSTDARVPNGEAASERRWADLEKAGWHWSSWHALTRGHPSHHRTGGSCCTLEEKKQKKNRGNRNFTTSRTDKPIEDDVMWVKPVLLYYNQV